MHVSDPHLHIDHDDAVNVDHSVHSNVVLSIGTRRNPDGGYVYGPHLSATPAVMRRVLADALAQLDALVCRHCHNTDGHTKECPDWDTPNAEPAGEMGNDGSAEMAHRSTPGLGARLDEAHALADLDDHRWDVA